MASNDVKLTYTNRSDNTLASLLVFTKNVNADEDAAPMAWRVIDKIGPNDAHQFVYTFETDIQVYWEDGTSYTLPTTATEGQGWSLQVKDATYNLLPDGTVSTPPDEIIVANKVPEAVQIDLIKDGKVIARKETVQNSMQACFKLLPKIYVGFVEEQTEGEFVKSSVLSQRFTMIDLSDCASLSFAATGNAGSGYRFVIDGKTPR